MATIKTKFKEFWSNVWKILKVPKYDFALAIGVFILLYLIKLCQSEPSTSWQYASLVVASIAAFFAGISSLWASSSLKKTDEALELTRKSMRPFMALQPGEISATNRGNTLTLHFEIKNTGPVPAYLVNADVAFFDEGEQITESNTSKKYPTEIERLPQLIVFPNAVYTIVRNIDLLEETGRKLDENMKKGKVKFRLRIVYRGQDTEHSTIQTEEMGKLDEKTQLMNRRPALPQMWT